MFKRLNIIIVLMTMGLCVSAQTVTDSVTVYFHKESALLDTSYMDNGRRIESFLEYVRLLKKMSADIDLSIQSIGSSSPEGNLTYNRMLAEKRQDRLNRLLQKELGIPSAHIRAHVIDEDWHMLSEEIKADPKVTSKDRILEIISEAGSSEESDEETIRRLLKVEYSRPYWYIYHNIFPKLRACRVIVTAEIPDFTRGGQDIEEFADAEIESEFVPLTFVPDSLPIMPLPLKRKGDLYIKANAIGYAMAAANIAVEYHFAEDWSICLPFYYSGVDYFKNTLKFRVCTLQPEVRYHIPGVEGMFVGAHLGVGWFNMALDGNYRIQDSAGKRPAWGGGLGLGYRMPFRKAPRWGIEFSLGAGVYDVRYDKFYNVHNGAYAGRNIHKVFFGIDNAAVSFTYRFDLDKGGRK